MPISVAQLLERLRDCELVSPREIEAVEARCPKNKRWQDAETLLGELIQESTLTRFQADALIANRGRTLVLGDYVILREIGVGGMGHVYLARHRRLKREVALKVMSANFSQNEAAVKRFQREMEAAARLSHPNIVATHDAREQNGCHYLVMEYVAGDNLANLVKRQGRLPVDTALDFVMQTARGLAHAHQQGVVHRDIKPANLLLDPEGRVKILDMGIARFDGAMLSGEPSGITKTGSLMGTAGYMAPEQALDVRQADARSDIYSLGCSLYFLLTGREMYQADTYMKQIVAHREDPIPPLTNLQDEPPPGLTAVFQKMVAKRPADRFQTMDKVQAALSACRGVEAPKLPVISDSIRVLFTPRDAASGQNPPKLPATEGVARGETVPDVSTFPREPAREKPAPVPSATFVSPPRTPSSVVAPTAQSSAVEAAPVSPVPVQPAPGKSLLDDAPSFASASKPDASRHSAVESAVYNEQPPDEPVTPGTAVFARYDKTLSQNNVWAASLASLTSKAASRNEQATQLEDDSASEKPTSVSRRESRATAREYGSPSQSVRWLPRLAAVGLLILSCAGLAVALVIANMPPGDKPPENARRNETPETPVTPEVPSDPPVVPIDPPDVPSDPPDVPSDPPAEPPVTKVVETVPDPPPDNVEEKRALAAKDKAEAARMAWQKWAPGLPDKFHPAEARAAAAKWQSAEAALEAKEFAAAEPAFANAATSFGAALTKGEQTRQRLEAGQAELDKLTAQRKEWQKTAQGIEPDQLPATAGEAEKAYRLAQESLTELDGLSQFDEHATQAGKLFDKSIASLALQRKMELADARSRARLALESAQVRLRAANETVRKFYGDSAQAKTWQATATGALTEGDSLGEADHLAALAAYARGTQAAQQLETWLLGVSGALEKRPRLPVSTTALAAELGGFAKAAARRSAGDEALRAGNFTVAERNYREASGLYPKLIAPFDPTAARFSQGEWAAALGARPVETNRQGMKLALIPPGEFGMGTSAEELDLLLASEPAPSRETFKSELPRHKVSLSRPWRLAVHETSQAEFEKVLGRNPSWATAVRLAVKDTSGLPVENVSWFDAVEFCNALSKLNDLPEYYLLHRGDDGTINNAEAADPAGKGYRLPTEAEWEFACRAGSRLFFHFGAALDGREANIDGDYPFGVAGLGPSLQRPCAVGRYASNSFGLCDMHGNVAEWCQDGYDADDYATFAASLAVDPSGGSDALLRAVRGGSWISYARTARSAARSGQAPSFHDLHIGFRVARTE